MKVGIFGIFGWKIIILEYTGEKDMNAQIDEKDPNNDNNLMNEEQEEFLIPGMV